MAEKFDNSYKLNETQLQQLKQIVPEAFKDGMLDFNSLYDSLSDYNEEDSIEMDDNFYGLYWPGKRAAKRAASIPPRGTLVPVKGDGVDEENTKNIYIEGDNLEVLKLLQKSYAGKIKMIYIDPPYNTGNDFVYNDDFSISSDQWLVDSGQVDDQGVRITTNSRADGRFHSKWLNMMYPRLKLAHSLLREDGVIFISIDDNEVAQLRKICDEIFGEENFVSQFIWKSKLGKVGTTSTISAIHEYIVCYGKSTSSLSFKMIERENDGRRENLRQWGQADRREDRPSMWYPITIDGIEVFPVKEDGTEGRWRVGKEMSEELLETGVLELVKKENKYEIYRNFESGTSIIPYDTLLLDEIGTTARGSILLKNLNMNKVFDYPKPIELVHFFLFLCTKENDIILDFFSGSATTAHAVMQLNAEDGGTRQYIMVQLEEKCDEKSEAYKAGFKNICEIGKERIRRAGKAVISGQLSVKSKEKSSDHLPLNTDHSDHLPLTTDHSLDIGFKVFRLSNSNYKKWQNYTGTDIKKAEDLFAQYENPLIDNWKEENLLTEIMLTEGFPLDSTLAVINEFKKNKVTQISSDFCEHSLFICLDKTIHAETIKALTLSQHDIFICLDNAVTDQDKVRLDDKGLIKTI